MTILFLILTLFLFNKQPLAQVKESTTTNRLNLTPENTVTVSARVGGYLFTIEGKTSPWAKVEFFSSEGNINAATVADDQGIFRFNSVLAPLETGEFCFLSYDTESNANNPLCFSPPPAGTKTKITGIFLSPTLSLNKGLLKQDEHGEAYGRAFPNTKIKIYLFSENKTLWREILDNLRVQAKEAPKLETTTAEDGSFSFNLPTQKSGNWRVFVGPEIEKENMAAKSNTLQYSSLPWWKWYLIQLLAKLLTCLKKVFSFLFRIETLIILLIITATTLGTKILQRKKKKKINEK